MLTDLHARIRREGELFLIREGAAAGPLYEVSLRFQGFSATERFATRHDVKLTPDLLAALLDGLAWQVVDAIARAAERTKALLAGDAV